MSWTLLLFVSGANLTGATVVLPPQPTVLEGYASQDTCEAALSFSIKKFKTEWRAVWGGCIPGS
jgi:hypothetical protein